MKIFQPKFFTTKLYFRFNLKKYFSVFQYKNYRIFFFSQFISLTGNWLGMIAQIWVVYQLTANPVMIGLATFSQQILILFFAPIGGILADKYSKKIILCSTQFLSFVIALIMATTALLGFINITILFILILCLGTISAIEVPVRQAFMIDMVTKEHIVNAIATNSMMLHLNRTFAPILGGIMLNFFGAGVCFLFNAISFVPLFLGYLSMRIDEKSYKNLKDSPKVNILDTIKFIFSTSSIIFIILMAGGVAFFLVPFQLFFPIYTDKIFHGGATMLGFFNSLLGMGSYSAALYVLVRSKTKRVENQILTSSLGLIVSVAVFVMSKNIYLSLATIYFAGFFTANIFVSSNGFLQTILPDHFRGRVISFYFSVQQGLMPFGAFLMGYLTSALSPELAILLSCISSLVISFLFFRKIPTILFSQAKLKRKNLETKNLN